ncbi:uncharacterized protein B0H18DRAFT_95410 [Fomitopsis serialis]|uniref:uncharacterized protein n=1 Tax=Fomitopsis serialis TaxID=139415 RepID=UPI002007CDCE|nr:uncharacterized protein B0H18DRAFT_95410 [Neoantrodia serialis]KAH9915542.1 hypothetical protein B0H18DRAFT_95410 [Neoantrodia serialis]
MEWDLRFADPKGEPRMTTLACCSLVCRTWYYLTWYHLRQCIHLRDRKDVLLLSKTLRERPRLREVVQQIIIYQSIQHLGTFAAMLVGKIPNLSMITIRDLEWTIGSVRIEDFSYLAAFCSVTTLHVYNITLSSVAPLAHLIAAFPRLRQLWCINVICSQTQASPVSLPLNFANLLVIDVRWVAPAVEDLFVRISQASRARALVLGVADETHPSPATSRSQTLLDATSASVEVAVLHIDISSPAHDVTIDAIVGNTTL